MQKLIEHLEARMEELAEEVRRDIPIWADMPRGYERDRFLMEIWAKGDQHEVMRGEVERLKKEFQTATPSADK